jgi:oxygen-independent coproporphyrinogen-3 oxidase
MNIRPPTNQVGTSEDRTQQLLATRMLIDAQAALEESFFLGLRLNRGISVRELQSAVWRSRARQLPFRSLPNLRRLELLESAADRLRLTPRGRLLSNEVFERFLKPANVRTTPA